MKLLKACQKNYIDCGANDRVENWNNPNVLHVEMHNFVKFVWYGGGLLKGKSSARL